MKKNKQTSDCKNIIVYWIIRKINSNRSRNGMVYIVHCTMYMDMRFIHTKPLISSSATIISYFDWTPSLNLEVIGNLNNFAWSLKLRRANDCYKSWRSWTKCNTIGEKHNHWSECCVDLNGLIKLKTDHFNFNQVLITWSRPLSKK